MLNIIGEALDELYRVFNILNHDYYENKLPEPVITIQKTRPNNLGHFTLGKVWKKKDEEADDTLARYEINLNPLNLNRSAEQIICTLQHEMVHYVNTISEIKDCNGQIHNKKFKEMAEKVGLICEKSKRYGWGTTECSDIFKKYITDKIKPDESVFEYFRIGGVEKEKKPREKKTFKYMCPGCGLVVKAERDKNIMCQDCNMTLEMEE